MNVWPKERTAILVIHGIGEQNPFETLDAFAGTFWNVLEDLNEGSFFPGQHRAVDRGGWVQNYISIRRNGGKNSAIDVYEYYWAHKVQRQATFSDIISWLVDTSEGARKFYAENEQIAEKYERDRVVAFEDKKFKRHWYLRYLGPLMRIVTIFPAAVPKKLSWLLAPLVNWFQRKSIDYIGDVVVYTTTDIKSRFFEIRKQILDGAAAELLALLQDKRYAKVIVAGHSLGSVIGYDALNRTNHAVNLKQVKPALARKVKGFVTFGSPLDKVAFFFREHTPDDQYLRRQILTHYHSFKAKPLTEQENPKELGNPFKDYFDHVHWMNFWDREDLVSGSLDFYRVDENLEVKMGANGIAAHLAYWEFRAMYEMVAKKLFVST